MNTLLGSRADRRDLKDLHREASVEKDEIWANDIAQVTAVTGELRAVAA
jgi:hypothetical protein